jgi:hypothetical protein
MTKPTPEERRERARLRSELARDKMGEEQVRTDITKDESARRQLETAIYLFFCEGDEISIHVLASSAFQILTDVCKSKNVKSFRDILMERVNPEWKKPISDKLKEAYNYFKHADRDTDDQLERFHPGVNCPVLFACCADYNTAFGDLPSALHIFYYWYLAIHPEIMLDGFPARELVLEVFNGMDQKSERERLRAGRELLRAYLIDWGEKLPVLDW